MVDPTCSCDNISGTLCGIVYSSYGVQILPHSADGSTSFALYDLPPQSPVEDPKLTYCISFHRAGNSSGSQASKMNLDDLNLQTNTSMRTCTRLKVSVRRTGNFF